MRGQHLSRTRYVISRNQPAGDRYRILVKSPDSTTGIWSVVQLLLYPKADSISKRTTKSCLPSMEQGSLQPATIPTLSALGHRSDATLGEMVQYAETINWGSLCVTLEDEQGRFRIWASNLGVLQPAESMKSLDRRLKDAPLMRKSVVSGLERLEGSAKRGKPCMQTRTTYC